jgi:hypothetical protein
LTAYGKKNEKEEDIEELYMMVSSVMDKFIFHCMPAATEWL